MIRRFAVARARGQCQQVLHNADDPQRDVPCRTARAAHVAQR